ncbi:MAG: methyltransferase domain-containing protein, partial [Verrucomicrobia bacterium]|nr:methyltransferase domain-containing protein [Verrucomicrobiota bacterium]
EDIFAWKAPKEVFTAVTSLAVIEHISDIKEFTRLLRGFIARDGLCIITTLNEDSIIYGFAKKMSKIGWKAPFLRLFSRHHRHHFTIHSLKTLLEVSGFKVEKHFTHNFPLQAVDFDRKGGLHDLLIYVGLAVFFVLGQFTGKAFLQTIVSRPAKNLSYKSP